MTNYWYRVQVNKEQVGVGKVHLEVHFTLIYIQYFDFNTAVVLTRLFVVECL